MFHLRVKIIGRSSGRNAAGAIAYRSGSRCPAAAMSYRAGVKLRDPRTGKIYDYSKKAAIDAEGFGILHTEVMLPEHAPEWLADRQNLIDAIEAKEIRDDAQLLREVELSLPRELTFDQQRELLREFVQTTFVSKGMIADVAMHDERASDGGRNPHAHILLTMRKVTPEGFGNKERAWNAKSLVHEWREAWAEMANEVLAEQGHERRLDHRSHAAREIDLEPDSYVGPSKGRPIDGVLHAERQEVRSAGKQKNIEAIFEDPGRLLDAITREKATFTKADVGYLLKRATALSPKDPLYDELMEEVLGSRDLVPIASDEKTGVRYATRSMIQCETEMAKAALTLARRETFDLDVKPSAELSIEQKQAFLHATQGADLVAITGVAGTGKTRTLEAIARAHEDAGYRVRGAAVAGIAAKQLTDGAGIPATTLAAAFYGWDRKDAAGNPDPIAPLRKGDVFVLDEAGMVASRDMRRLLVEAEKAEAKVILVGDTQQLEAIEAGAPFRALVDTHGAATLQDVRRQQQDWQRTASQMLSQHKVPAALDLYRQADAIKSSASTEDAMDKLVEAYMADRERKGSQLILAHSNADVKTLNTKVRSALRAEGAIGEDVKVQLRERQRDENGEIIERAKSAMLATGDKLLFTKNDKKLGVQNGLVGNVLELDPSGQLKVDVGNGRVLDFHTRDYNHLELGYAMTVHKAQGATYDRSYVLASRRLDARLAYVALTRHREEAQVFYGRDQFERPQDLDWALSRRRPKDSTLDYLDAYKAMQRTETQGRSSGGRDQRNAQAKQTKPRVDTPRPEPKPTWARGPQEEPSAPRTPIDRIRDNAERRQQAQARDRRRTRDYGE